jgi:hypothetical protein
MLFRLLFAVLGSFGTAAIIYIIGHSEISNRLPEVRTFPGGLDVVAILFIIVGLLATFVAGKVSELDTHEKLGQHLAKLDAEIAAMKKKLAALRGGTAPLTRAVPVFQTALEWSWVEYGSTMADQ